MIFANPLVLWSFVVLVPVFLSSIRRKKLSFIFPTDESISAAKKSSMKTRTAAKLDYLRLAAASLVIVALAGPQAKVDAMTRKEGLAVILAIDCSSTMAADDVKLGLGDLAGKEVRSGGQRTKRIDAARTVAIDFVKSRPDDIVGVVAFAAQAFTLSPPTFDHEWVERSLRRADTGLIKDGTAIGSGILASLGALEGIKAKGKAVILLTDGINNFGSVPPMVA
ncbi:MAG: VWA domain-containing protein, partial [Candidatus Omnitrophica bacterium]|nr:VWA domain-containing protein [Candidatus Omnitrophota bacterium]